MMPFRKFSIVVVAEKSAIAKTSVGVLGTWITAHEIQIIVGIATLIFMAMQIITMIPKVRSSMRQMAVDRERDRQKGKPNFSDIKIEGFGEQKKTDSVLDRIRRLFNVSEE